VYLRTGHEYRRYFSRRKGKQALDTYKRQLKFHLPTEWTAVYKTMRIENLPDQPYQVIKSTYITFPTIIEPEKTDDIACLSTTPNTPSP
jgi:hypothetical protein